MANFRAGDEVILLHPDRCGSCSELATITSIGTTAATVQFPNNAKAVVPLKDLAYPKEDKKYNRQFDTGATRDVSDYKFDYEAFGSPLVVNRYAQYMHKHRKQEDGQMRSGDNWQKGIPNGEYLKSMWRHFLDVWALMRGYKCRDPKTNEEITLQEALCGVKFNVDGFLFNLLKEENPVIYNGEKQFEE